MPVRVLTFTLPLLIIIFCIIPYCCSYHICEAILNEDLPTNKTSLTDLNNIIERQKLIIQDEKLNRIKEIIAEFVTKRKEVSRIQNLPFNNLKNYLDPKIKELKKNINSFNDIDKFAVKGAWVEDIIDFTPNLYKLVSDLDLYGEIRDDCDGLARWAYYLYAILSENKDIIYPVAEYILFPHPQNFSRSGHIITILKITSTFYKIYDDATISFSPSIKEYIEKIKDLKNWPDYVYGQLPTEEYEDDLQKYWIKVD